MRGPTATRRARRRRGAFPARLAPGLALLGLGLLGPAAAAEPAEPGPAREPVFCTPDRCRPAAASPLSRAAGFALAALACGLVARR